MARRPAHTHFVDFDQPGTRTARALCYALVERRAAVADPTCPRCRDLLLYRDRIVEGLAAGIVDGVARAHPHGAGCSCTECFAAWLDNRDRRP